MDVDFKKVTLSDKQNLQKYYKNTQYKSCDNSFASIFLWSIVHPVKYAIINDMLVFLYTNGKNTFTFPVGNGDLKSTINILMEYSNAKKFEFRMILSQDMADDLQSIFSDKFQINYNRDLSEYIYNSESLRTLTGKKLHSKRNHINKFNSLYDWQYEDINNHNIDECVDLLKKWCKENDCMEDEHMFEEACVARKALAHKDFLGLDGGLLRVKTKENPKGDVVAFCLGEAISFDTYAVHFEKADSNIKGAYNAINQQFVKRFALDYNFVNREDDAGCEGLRKAKLSYKPVMILQKGIATIKEQG